jgi:hypothetical protein
MTLSIGSIFGDQGTLSQETLRLQDNRLRGLPFRV